jgi:hypothetical protein
MGFMDTMFGKGPELNFEQSPQQAEMYKTMFPIFQNFMQGNFPSIYDVPSPVGPTSGWYDNIAPEVRQSLWEPAREGGRQMMEVMGAKGQIGSAGSPISGSAATGVGKLFSDYSQGIGGQAWNMMQPGLMADYQAQLGRNITGYQTSLMPFQTAANMLPGTYASPVVTPGSQGLFQNAMQMAAPFALGATFGLGGMSWPSFGGMGQQQPSGSIGGAPWGGSFQMSQLPYRGYGF